jgi:hypothetical protein
LGPDARIPSVNIFSNRFLFGPLTRAIQLNGQLVATLIAASLEDVLTVGRLHSHAKAVSGVSLAVIGLERSLHAG